MTEHALAFLASVVAGAFGALVGIGGGLVIVPVLTVAFGVPIKSAIAASLIGVIATSTTAAVPYLRSGLADRRLGLVLLVATAGGGVLGGLTATLLDGRALSALFGFVLMAVAIQMVRSADPRPPEQAAADEGAGILSNYLEPTTGRTVAYRARRVPAASATSVVAGAVSGLLGVGGGVINVPTMSLLMRVPIRVATTTSTYMLGATAAASAVIYYARDALDPLLAAPVALGMLIGARGGANVAGRVSVRALRLAFVVVALVFAVQMFARVVQR